MFQNQLKMSNVVFIQTVTQMNSTKASIINTVQENKYHNMKYSLQVDVIFLKSEI